MAYTNTDSALDSMKRRIDDAASAAREAHDEVDKAEAGLNEVRHRVGEVSNIVNELRNEYESLCAIAKEGGGDE